MLFKMLLLQQWDGYSDTKVVEAVHDSRSIGRFIGQDIRNYYVDATTLVVFRKRLRSAQIEGELLEMINTQLAQKGYFVRKGTIIDSTLVAAATKAGRTKRDGTLVDPDVETVKRKDAFREGMKVHVGMDSVSELIESVALSSVRVHDHCVFEEMIPEETEAVYADKAYDSEAHRDYLRKHGMRNGILRKAQRNHPLTTAQKERNKERGVIRGAIERKINDLKRWCHLTRLRYYTKERNWLQVLCAVIAVNLKRAVKLEAVRG